MLQIFIILTILLGLETSSVELLNITDSDPSLFTQGFESWDDKNLLIGSGLYGKSDIGLLNIEDGTFESMDQLDNQYFGEGVTITPSGIWQLTWKSGQAFLRDSKTFEIIKTVSYETEGWGIAYDEQNDCLWMSDGTSSIYQRDAESFELLDQFELIDGQGHPVGKINELEWANGNIYANIWYTQTIAVIDPQEEKLIKTYDLSTIVDDLDLTQSQRDHMDVLNGIAHKEDNLFYLTGKNYPIIMEVRLN